VKQAQGVEVKTFTRGNLYFMRQGAAESGPFCPRCYVKEDLLMRLTKLDPMFKEAGTYNCPECDALF
jgi:hypothetical protein